LSEEKENWVLHVNDVMIGDGLLREVLKGTILGKKLWDANVDSSCTSGTFAHIAA